MAGGLIHVGGWTGMEYRFHKGPLIVFEPQAEAFAKLERNCPGAECHNVALGAADGEATIYTATPSHSSSLLPPLESQFDHISFGGTEAVKMTTLDAVMNGRNGYDTLRIDTQGYELEVLKGAIKTLAQINRVECEIHDSNTYPGAGTLEQVDAFLDGLGFVRVETDVEGSDDLVDVAYERPR